MTQHQDSAEASIDGPVVLMIAGFGDTSEMYDGLLKTRLADTRRLVPVDLPGFGQAALEGPTDLQSLAAHVAEIARKDRAEFIIAHSVASVIASLAATQSDCPLRVILSLEGNLTAEDAYFSGTAADYDDPSAFRNAFLARLEDMARTDQVIARYRQKVALADPQALWELGRDARRFSDNNIPGQVLMAAATVIYFYNPDNCPQASLDWLAGQPFDRVVLKDASHWPSVDRPALLAAKIEAAMRKAG